MLLRTAIVHDCFHAIESHHLSRLHIDLLETFVWYAVDIEAAIAYIINQDERSLRRIALALEDLCMMFRYSYWPAPSISQATMDIIIQRDNGRCCLTKHLPSRRWFGGSPISVWHVVSPAFMSLPRIAEGGDISDLLDIMYTKSRMTEIRTMIEAGSHGHRSEENLWYISDHIQHQLRRSAVLLDPMLGPAVARPGSTPTTESVYDLSLTNLSTRPLVLADGTNLDVEGVRFPINAAIPFPNTFLAHFFNRISQMAYCVGVDENRKRGVYRSRFEGLAPVPVRFYRWLFGLLSPSIRVRVYSLLIRWGRSLYGAPDFFSGLAQRAPFGLYIKQGHDLASLRNEENALKLIEQRTTIPAPRHIDTLIAGNLCFMIVTRVPGQPLGKIFETLSMDDIERLRGEIADAVRQLRAIKNPHQAVICNTIGRPVQDYWFGPGECKLLDSEAEFDKYLQRDLDSDKKKEWNTFPPHEIVLTHGDLHAHNLIVLNGRLSGIIDWELAGWLPTYWEYIKFDILTTPHAEVALLRPAKIFAKLGEDWSRQLTRQRVIWESLGL